LTVVQTEVFEAFRAIDIPEDKALKAAAALSKRDDDVALLKTDTSILKWMIGFVLAFQVAIFAKLFLHRRDPPNSGVSAQCFVHALHCRFERNHHRLGDRGQKVRPT
jgi:hypothetical protein